jgi:hypothetical protein
VNAAFALLWQTPKKSLSMDNQLNITVANQVTLSEKEQEELVKFVVATEKQGRDARSTYEKHWKECNQAYHAKADPILDEEMEWQSNLCLPWAYDAVESAYAYYHQTLLPKDDQIFTIDGRTPEDKDGAEVMEKYCEHRFNKNKFPEKIGQALKQLLKKNHTCVKQYWRKDTRIEYPQQLVESIDPETGESVQTWQQQPQTVVEYNNTWIDVIDIDNFVFYPIWGDFNKTTQIHCTYRYYDELMAAGQQQEAPYFNLDKIKPDDDESYKPYNSDGSAVERDIDGNVVRKNCGLKLKEAWISRVKIGDTVYNNYIATVVNDKWLIRFQPNDQPMGKSPFLWLPMDPDGDCLYGYGLLSKGLPILQAANFIFNMRLDELKLKLYGSYKYWDDGVFNPYNVVSRPGAMIETAGPESATGNLVPLNPNLQHVQLAYTEVAELQAEFEEVTVPKAVKGQQEARDATATEISTVANSASNKMHVKAYNINDRFLQPLVEKHYADIYEKQNEDPDIKLEIARLTQNAVKQVVQDPDGQPTAIMKTPEELIASLPPFIPLPEVDIKVVAYQNQIRKQETLQNLAQVLPQIAQFPQMGKYWKWYGVDKMVIRLADLPKDELLMDETERDEADKNDQQQQQQQQEMQMMQMKAQYDLEVMKEQNSHEIELKKIQLEYEKLALENQKLLMGTVVDTLGQPENGSTPQAPEPQAA